MLKVKEPKCFNFKPQRGVIVGYVSRHVLKK